LWSRKVVRRCPDAVRDGASSQSLGVNDEEQHVSIVRFVSGLGLLAVSVVALGGVLPAADAAVGLTVVTVPAVIEQLAADGPRVAVGVAGLKRPGVACSPVYVWDRTSGRIEGYGDCWGPAVDEWISQVAMAGKQVAWIDVSVGNGAERTVYKATPGRDATFDDMAEAPAEGGGEPGGDYLGHLHGAGSLLVFNAWSQCYPDIGDNADYGFTPICEKGKPSTSGIEVKRLARPGKEATTLARGPSVAPVLSVDAGRIVVGGKNRQLIVLQANGSVLRRVTVQGAVVRDAALAGSEIAVLEPSRLELYSVSSGQRIKSFPLAPQPSQRKLAGLGDGYVALVEHTSIHVIRLRDAKSTTLSFPHALGPVRAQLVAAGLYYSYNDRQAPQTGHLAFLPLQSLATRF
jgi:hypothetical protein